MTSGLHQRIKQKNLKNGTPQINETTVTMPVFYIQSMASLHATNVPTALQNVSFYYL